MERHSLAEDGTCLSELLSFFNCCSRAKEYSHLTFFYLFLLLMKLSIYSYQHLFLQFLFILLFSPLILLPLLIYMTY